jgi:hypothetical protein
MRTRILFLLFILAVLLCVGLFAGVIFARRGERAALHAVRDFYVEWLGRDSTTGLSGDALVRLATVSFADTVSGASVSGEDAVLCGGGIPLQVRVTDASTFWGEGAAIVELVGATGSKYAQASVLYEDGTWRMDGIGCIDAGAL